MASSFTTVVLAFDDFVSRNRVLRPVWVGYRYVTVVANRDLRPVWQRGVSILVLVGIFDRLDNFGLFIVRQLGWVINLYLVAWHIWFVLVGIVLLFNQLVTVNRVLRPVWVGYGCRPIIVYRDLRPVWQCEVAFVVLVGIFERLRNFFFFLVGQLSWIVNLHLVTRHLRIIRLVVRLGVTWVCWFDQLVAVNRVLRPVWVGYHSRAVVTRRNVRAFWEVILVSILDRLFNLTLFITGQLGWIVNLHLVARNDWIVLFIIGLGIWRRCWRVRWTDGEVGWRFINRGVASIIQLLLPGFRQSNVVGSDFRWRIS